MTFDMILCGGLVVDGTGAQPYRADVGVCGGLIAAVGDLSNAFAHHRIAANGLIVCPGFIDVHSHSDINLLLDPEAPSKIAQGITTEVIGNCGASAAPRFGRRRLPSDWEAHALGSHWERMSDYLSVLTESRPMLNVVALVGHNALRGCVAGYDARPLSTDEMTSLLGELETALDHGAAGVSFGLAYSPGMFAPQDELDVVTRVAARRDAIVTVHLRSEGDALLESLEEVIDLARATNARLQISHLKTSGPRNWSKIERALESIERARAAGVRIAADCYPYTVSATDLDVILPKWATAGDRREILARLSDPKCRQRIRAELLEERSNRTDWARILLGSSRHESLRRFTGQSLETIGAQLGMEPVDAALWLMIKDELRSQAFFQNISEPNMWRILAQRWVMLGTDTGVRSPIGVLSRDHPHPRAYGTMPRFLRASLDGRTVALAEAVHRMTMLPAEHFKLQGRGRVAPGMWADLVVLNSDRISDRADFSNPHVLSDGIETVIVNGVPTWRDGRTTGQRPGRVLRPGD